MCHSNWYIRNIHPLTQRKIHNLLISSLAGESCEEIDPPAVYHLFKTWHQREFSLVFFVDPEEGGHWCCLCPFEQALCCSDCKQISEPCSLRLSSDLSTSRTLSNARHSWPFSLFWKMSFGPNDIRSKILKCWCPGFSALESFQINSRFGSYPDWLTEALSKSILWNMWNGTSILLPACKSVLIVLWIGHANFHLCLGHCELIGTSSCFSNVFILLPSSFHKATNDLDMFLTLYFWCLGLGRFFEERKKICDLKITNLFRKIMRQFFRCYSDT